MTLASIRAWCRAILEGADVFVTLVSFGPINPLLVSVGPVNWNDR